jgi:hypothetical protein
LVINHLLLLSQGVKDPLEKKGDLVEDLDPLEEGSTMIMISDKLEDLMMTSQGLSEVEVHPVEEDKVPEMNLRCTNKEVVAE